MFGLFSKTELPQYNEGFGLEEQDGRFHLVPVSKPLAPLRRGQVLVKMVAASINPSDLVFMRSQYGIEAREGVIPGLEGAGQIIACGKGVASHLMLGRRVACTPRAGEDGTWARYMVTSVNNCVPLLPKVTYQEGATLLVNPLSAWLMYQRVKALGTHSVLVTVSGGTLGAMLVRLGHSLGYTVVALVRHGEQRARIKSLGAHEVLWTGGDHFADELKEVCHRVGTGVVLDGAGASLSEQLAKAVPTGARFVVYGTLGGNTLPIRGSDLIFSEHSYEGFWMSSWAKRATKVELAKTFLKVQRRLKKELSTPLYGTFPLEQVKEAIATYKRTRSEGKTLLLMEQ